MKKIISIFVIIVLALSPAAVSATAQAVEFVLGDVNGDGIVSISDATAIQRHLAQLELIPEEKLNASMVNDGKTLTISDATTIQKKLAELIDRFPVEEQTDEMKMFINSTSVTVEWEDNESVATLKEAVKANPITIHMSMYGGFEQFGSLGISLPRNDTRITTKSGDVILYSGNQMVVFYGSNTWAYTRLGHITDKTQAELATLLSNGNVTVILTF